MLNYFRQLAGRKGKTLRSASRARQRCLSLELLGERILLTAGSSILPFIGPMLPGTDKLVPISSNYDDPFARAANVEWMDLADFDASSPTRLSGPRVVIEDEDFIYRLDATTGQ